VEHDASLFAPARGYITTPLFAAGMNAPESDSCVARIAVLVLASLSTRDRAMCASVVVMLAGPPAIGEREVMKRLIKCLAPLLVLVACGVESPDIIESTPSTQSVESSTPVAPEASTTTAEPDKVGAPQSLLDTCAAISPGICSNASIGEFCGIGPRWCLPAQDLPDGSIFCLCQSQATN
jgi:hypothetical protein